MRFDWDSRKATSNKRKHGVTFNEAAKDRSISEAPERHSKQTASRRKAG